MDQILDYDLNRARAEYVALLLSPETGITHMYKTWRAERRFDKISQIRTK